MYPPVGPQNNIYAIMYLGDLFSSKLPRIFHMPSALKAISQNQNQAIINQKISFSLSRFTFRVSPVPSKHVYIQY